jgi:uncharacterized protein
MFAALESGQRPPDYQPLTKIIRRLMLPQPITRFCGVAGTYLGISSKGKIYPCFRHLGVKEYELGDVDTDVNNGKRLDFLGKEAAPVDKRPICQDCWARYLCGGGCYADSTIYSSDKLKPQIQHCPFWRVEAETAMSLYHRMRTVDSELVLKLFGTNVNEIFEAKISPEMYFPRPSCS